MNVMYYSRDVLYDSWLCTQYSRLRIDFSWLRFHCIGLRFHFMRINTHFDRKYNLKKCETVIYYSYIVIYHSDIVIYYTEYIINYHRIHLYYKTSLSIAHYLHIIFKWNIFMCHNIIAFHSILIARMAKPASKTKKSIQAKLGSLTKAGTKGKKRSASLKNIALPISNKQKKSWGSLIWITCVELLMSTWEYICFLAQEHISATYDVCETYILLYT